MDDLIKQFRLEAERHAHSICGFCGHDDYNILCDRKFVELVVAECGKVAKSHEVPDWRSSGTDWGTIFRDRFGV